MREKLCKVSVIIPAYNVGKFLPRCLDSVLRQSFEAFEVIVVDDGSKDDTAKIMDEYVFKDTRVRYIFKENGGVTSARHCGVNNACGEYLFFLDGDDYIPSNALDVLYKNAVEFESDIVSGLFVLVKDRKKKLYCSQVFDSITSTEYMKLLTTGKTSWILCSKLIKRKLYQIANINIPMDLPVGEDALTLFQLMSNVNRVSMVNEIIYCYVQHDISVMHRRSTRLGNDNLRAGKLVSDVVRKRGKEMELYAIAVRLLFLLATFKFGRWRVKRDEVKDVLNLYKENREVMRLFSWKKRMKIQFVLLMYKWY